MHTLGAGQQPCGRRHCRGRAAGSVRSLLQHGGRHGRALAALRRSGAAAAGRSWGGLPPPLLVSWVGSDSAGAALLEDVSSFGLSTRGILCDLETGGGHPVMLPSEAEGTMGAASDTPGSQSSGATGGSSGNAARSNGGTATVSIIFDARGEVRSWRPPRRE